MKKSSKDLVNQIRAAYHAYDEKKWDVSNPGNRAMILERWEGIKELLQTSGFIPLYAKRVLDIGCGYGEILAALVEWGAQPGNLYGIDVLPDRIETACRKYPNTHFTCGNAEHLDFPDAYFDLVLLFTVFSSILDDGMAHNVAKEVRRVLKPGGAVLWYDFRYNNPWNPNVRGMTKRHIREFFPDFELYLRTITLLPPLARRLGRLTPVLYPLLAAIPPLRTHCIGLFSRE